MMYHGIEFQDEKIAAFCRRHGIARFALFGSILSDEFAADSDVDVLIEFLPGRVPGLIRLAGMEQELTAMLGRKVDLRTPGDLSRCFRDRVVAEARVQYAA